MDTVFDIGMYNGADSAYYLELGFKVIAVEANPVLVERARNKFREEIGNGTFTLISGAIGETDGETELIISGDDPGSSSTILDHVQKIQPIGSYRVDLVQFSSLISMYGVPYFLKVDIEGSDRHCILPLTSTTVPRFLSFEIGSDFEELFAHVRSIGCDRFKIIDQAIFRDVSRVPVLSDRIRLRLMMHLGFGSPRMFRRNGRFFRTGSSGPVPWRSDGNWVSAGDVEAIWASKVRSGQSWYDLQATRGS